MVTLAILASFFGGVIVGAILLATYRGSVVVEVPVIVPAPEPVVISPPPAPEPEPEPEPEPAPAPAPEPPGPVTERDRFLCVLVRDGAEESVRTMAYLPPKIERQHGPWRSETYRYVGLDPDGRHRFEMTTHG